jgi:hypothetical protein
MILHVAAGRGRTLLGAAGYAAGMVLIEPLATALMAAVFAVDAITRERDEGSFGVVSLAPFSGAGYLLRRWVGLLTLLLPLTMLPSLIAWSLASIRLAHAAAAAPFVGSWLLHVVPSLAIFSALALAIGTITGQTVLAAIVAAVVFSAGIVLLNDIAAHTHRRFDGIGALTNSEDLEVEKLVWAIRGWGGPAMPTEAGYPWHTELDRVLPEAALACTITALLFGFAPFYLRRTRPDIRPWRIAGTNQLRTLLRQLNRARMEFTPDRAVDVADWLLLAAGVAVAVTVAWTLVARYDRYARLAAEEYASLQHPAAVMPASVVASEVAIDGDVRANGELRATSRVMMRNDGDVAVHQLAFALTPSVQIAGVEAGRGHAKLRRLWDRVAIELDPPLGVHETRRLDFRLEGIPGRYRFPIHGDFEQAYRVYARATTSTDLLDLSRSWLDRAANDTFAVLHSSDLVPVPRYTPWAQGAEQITPMTRLSTNLRFASIRRAGDSCGVFGNGNLRSACTTSLGHYQIVGGPFVPLALDDRTALLYLDAHTSLAPLQGPALAKATRIAREAWPRLAMSERALFIERPAERNETDWFRSWDEIVEPSGSAYLIAERMFARKEAFRPSVVATAFIVSALRAQRRVEPAEQYAFTRIYNAIASIDTGGKKTSAVIPPVSGVAPSTQPILAEGENTHSERAEGVVAELEYRVGHERLKEGVQDFLRASPEPGTVSQLLDAIGRRGGVDLRRVYTDYFTGRAQPRLTLSEVQFTRSGVQWQVRGVVENKGTGESFCPIVLRTSAGSLTQTLRVDSAMRVPFVFTTDYAPRTLQLDPQRVCYRFQYVGSIDSVDYKGPES